jgi:hypothetical protein
MHVTYVASDRIEALVQGFGLEKILKRKKKESGYIEQSGIYWSWKTGITLRSSLISVRKNSSHWL